MKKTLLFILIFLGALSLHAQEHHKITIDVEMDSITFTQGNPSNLSTCMENFAFGMSGASGLGYITYRWEQSPDNATWSTVSGAITANPTLTVTSNTYFRRIATSSTCGNSITSNSALVTFDRPPLPKFMAYNLGADSTITDPKDQMAYLSTQTNQLNGHVFGGCYQWGRQPVDYAINPSTYLRYSGSGTANHTVAWTSSMVPDGNGQLPGQDDYHVYSTSARDYDWSIPHNNALWGNGQAITYDFTPNGVLHTDGKYYQKPVKTENDPCPPGYRVPTQNDWELMGNYNCNPSSAAGIFSTSSLITKPANNSGLTWVNVRCGGGDCTVSNSWSSGGSSPWGGYAIYKTSVWEAAPVASGGSLIAAGAPQPLLFLPAAGNRNDNSGNVSNVGRSGYYWSSSISGTYAYSLYFDSTNVSPGSNSNRAAGYSVRCVAE